MRHTWSALACAMAMALSVVGIGNAHHGTAAYDTTTTVTVTGVVTEFKPGDEITVTGRPAKNKTTTMAISKIVLNGKELTSGGND
jgi:hypothetical protein